MSTKIRLINLSNGCDCRTYSGPSGQSYEFYMGRFTEVKDSADALHFLKAANGTAFEVEKGPVKKAIDALKKLLKEKVVDEEKAPEESGILDADPDAPIDAIDPSEPTANETVAEIPEEVDPEETKDEKVLFEDFTYDGLKALNGKQQTFLIKAVNAEEKIPRLESGKIELLLKFQKEGSNLVELLKGYVN